MTFLYKLVSGVHVLMQRLCQAEINIDKQAFGIDQQLDRNEAMMPIL